ncbi:Thymidylate kinase [Halomicrobium zhouii]|uniref:Thymidylate kinase n=1 Tax=Halomicrobium zhouii TaxID=767519 RepID=A0A1I6LY53_9EURY|nr:hypothetical protein [Halomicrobium zhouii]SFS08328.1 Thymidylate kinase [Halomicrobium zhouii]
MAGTFVVLEGGAGTGKSALLDALSGEFTRRGISIETVPEFAEASVGEFVADELDRGDGQQFQERACSLSAGMLANCCYQAETVINDALETNEIVLTERYLDSVAVYNLPLVEQRSGSTFPPIIDATDRALPVSPDLTVLLTMNDQTRRERFRNDRPELLEQGSVPDRFSQRQARFRERLAGRDDVLIFENDDSLETAAATLAEEINRER